MLFFKILQGTIMLDLPHELSLLHTITRVHNKDTRSPFQELMFTSIVSFHLLLNYGIVY